MIIRFTTLLVFFLIVSASAGEGIPGTFALTPTINLDLQPVAVKIPKHFRPSLGDEDLKLRLPPGFSVRVFAAPKLFGPRFMAFDNNGVLHVANMRVPGDNQGQIVALPDRDDDGVADACIVVADGFRRIHSLAFHRGSLYAADNHQLLRLIDADDDGFYEGRDLLAVLPSADDVYQGRVPGDVTPPAVQDIHPTRTILFDPLNERIYVSIGSTCDLCREYNPERASVLAFNFDGSGRRIFASGLRNATGLALHPDTNDLWATVNGHDREGNVLPPEAVYIVRDGSFYGWPFAYAWQVYVDFSVGAYKPILPLSPADSNRVRTMPPPVALVPARQAPMAIHFYTGQTFPVRYQDAAFVVFRAGHNALVPGWKVMTLFSEADGSNARVADFLTGLGMDRVSGSGVWGTPVGLAQDSAGHLYLSTDFVHNAILRIEAPLGATAIYNTVEPILYSMEQNYPNPFNLSTNIIYYLPTATHVNPSIYNLAGQVVRNLQHAAREAGRYQVKWQGKDNSGVDLASGIYFYRLQTAYGTITRRLLLLK